MGTLFNGNAASSGYIMVQLDQVAAQWTTFTEAMRQELFSMDSVCRYRDKPKSVGKKASLSSYINEVRSSVIGIPGIRDRKWMEIICSCLKPMAPLSY